MKSHIAHAEITGCDIEFMQISLDL
uniref:Uncharacterized protein n=1 Tax=Rhizophora mucronata TaxID=61149 RepID=A0A2P2NEV8_RHIMU